MFCILVCATKHQTHSFSIVSQKPRRYRVTRRLQQSDAQAHAVNLPLSRRLASECSKDSSEHQLAGLLHRSRRRFQRTSKWTPISAEVFDPVSAPTAAHIPNFKSWLAASSLLSAASSSSNLADTSAPTRCNHCSGVTTSFGLSQSCTPRSEATLMQNCGEASVPTTVPSSLSSPYPFSPLVSTTTADPTAPAGKDIGIPYGDTSTSGGWLFTGIGAPNVGGCPPYIGTVDR